MCPIKKPKLLNHEYAVYRPDIVDYICSKILPHSKKILDPMAGTAPLLPSIQYLGLTAFFNDIMPLHYYINSAKTYKIYKSINIIDKKKKALVKRDLLKCMSKLKNKKLLLSKDWFHEDVLKGLVNAWHKTDTYEKSHGVFYKAAILLSIRSFCSVSKCKTNASWFKPGGLTPNKDLEQVIEEALEKFSLFYQYYYSDIKIVNGGKCFFTIGDAAGPRKQEKVDTIITSPPYPNRFDYTKMYAPELFFLSQVDTESNINKVIETVIATTAVSDYKKDVDSVNEDRKYIRDNAPMTDEFLISVESKRPRNARTYYLPYYLRYFVNLYRLLNYLMSLLVKNGSLYLIVQNNTHRGELINMPDFIIDYFNCKGLKAQVVFKEPRVHQGRRNISAEYPLVLKKQLESIVWVKK